MAIKYTMIGNNPENIKTEVFNSNKKKNTKNLIAKGDGVDDFYKNKAEFDAKRDMMKEKYDPTEGRKRGKKLLDDLLGKA